MGGSLRTLFVGCCRRAPFPQLQPPKNKYLVELFGPWVAAAAEGHHTSGTLYAWKRL